MRDSNMIKLPFRTANTWRRMEFRVVHRLGARALLLACLLSSASSGQAQDTANVFARRHILKIAIELQGELKDPAIAANGIAERRLDDSTQVAFRNRSGQGELHANADDIFFVISGTATLVTGGSIVHPKGDVEVRGESVRGGSRVQLRPGDVVHIPRSTPHQVLVKPGSSVVYVVVKIPHVP